MRYKHCVVSGCTSNAKRMPTKIFNRVPDNVEIRKKWFELARRDVRSGNCHICEDHFDIEKDIANYFKYKMGFTKKITIVDGVLPSKFHWQQGFTKEMCDDDAVISQPNVVKCQILVPIEERKASTLIMQECEENLHHELYGQQAFTTVMSDLQSKSTEFALLHSKSIKSEMQPGESKICQQGCGEILPDGQENADLFTFPTMSKGHLTIDSHSTQEENTFTEPIVSTEKSTQCETSTSETFAGLNLCRVCMEDHGTISLFSWEQDVQRCEMMSKCAAVEVSQGDGLPDSICGKCAAELAASYQFALRCKASDNSLRSRIKLELNSRIKEHPTEQSDNDTTHEYTANVQYSNEKDEVKLYNYYKYDHTNDNYNTVKNKVEICIEKAEDFNENKHHLNQYEYKVVDVEKIKKESICTRKSRYKKGSLRCTKCKKKFSQLSTFNRHMKSHDNVKQFTCDMCNKCFSSKGNMEQHKHNQHYSVKRKRVQKTFIEKKSLRPKTMCSICGRNNSSLQALEEHIKTHSSQKPFACEYCGLEYKLKHTLKDHLQNAHPDLYCSKKFICDYCGITVYSKAKMNYHMKIHMPSRWFKCPLCPKILPRITHLAAHKKQHSSIKPFKCQFCSWSFYEFYMLQKHYIVHKNERDFICNVCNKGFKSKDGLKTHMVSHNKDKPWMCSVCGKMFNLKSNMMAHTKRVHSKNWNG